MHTYVVDIKLWCLVALFNVFRINRGGTTMGFRHVDGYTFFEGSGTDKRILAYTLIKKLLTARS